MSNIDLFKHTAAVHINSILTLNQRKIANILLYNSYSEISEDKVHSMRISQILDSLGWSSDSEVTALVKNDLRALNKFQLEWNIFNKDKKNCWGVTTLLADVRIENGWVNYTYSKSLREMLFNPNIYAKLDLIIQRNLKNKHALVLWEYLVEALCSSRQNEMNTEPMRVEDLRKLLGVLKNKSYDNYAVFKAQAITPALKEINAKSDICVNLVPKREGRKIVKVVFVIKRKIAANLDQKILTINNDEVVDFTENYGSGITIDKWVQESYCKIGISIIKALKDIKDYGEHGVKSALKLTLRDLKNGKNIKSLAGYYYTALKQNWDYIEDTIDTKEIIASEEIAEQKNKILSNEVGIALSLKEKLLEKYGPVVFKSWLSDIKIEIVDSITLTIKASSPFKANWITSHYEDEIAIMVHNIDASLQYVKIISL